MKNFNFIILFFISVSLISLSSCQEAQTVDIPEISNVSVKELAEQKARIELAETHKTLLLQCNQDDFAACLKLAETYPLRDTSGEINARNMKYRQTLYEKACDGAYAPGCSALSLHWRSREDLNQVLSASKLGCELGDVMGCFLYHNALLDQPESDREPLILSNLRDKICQMDPQETCHELGALLQDRLNESIAAKHAFETSCNAGVEMSCYRAIDSFKLTLDAAAKAPYLSAYRKEVCKLSKGTVCTSD